MRCYAMVFMLFASAAAWAGGNCNPAAAAGPRPASGRILFDRGGEVWVMDGDGQHQKMLLQGAPWASLSGDGEHVAFWEPTQKTVRVLSLDSGCLEVIDTLQGPVGDIGWSEDGHTLAYVGRSARGSGLHVLPYPVGAAVPKLFPGFNHVSLSPDGRYALATDMRSVLEVDLLTGERKAAYKTASSKDAIWGADLAHHGGGLMGVALAGDSGPAAEDDEPDCSSGTTSLRVVNASGTTTDVPFPDGFSSILDYDFDFSPDGKQVAITFGAERCDYPGDVAAVYLFDLGTHKFTRLSPENRLAGRVKFSPDGKAVIYTDFVGTGTTGIYRVELADRRPRAMTKPREMDSDFVIDWR